MTARTVKGLAVALVTLWTIGCDKNMTNPTSALEPEAGGGEAVVYLPQIPEGFLSKNASGVKEGRLQLTITGPGLDTMTYGWPVSQIPKEPVVIEKIPAGENRVFTGKLFHSTGEISHEGTAIADIISGETARVYLSLKRASGSAAIYIEIEGLTPPGDVDFDGCWRFGMTPEGQPMKKGLLKLKQNPGGSVLGTLEFAEGRSYRVAGSVVSLGKYPTLYLDAFGKDTSFHMLGTLRGPCLMGQVKLSLSGRARDRVPYGKWNACPTETCVIPEPPKPIPPSPGLKGTWEMTLQPRDADSSVPAQLRLSYSGDKIGLMDSLWGVLYFERAKFLVHGRLRVDETPQGTSIIILFLTEHTGSPFFGHIEMDLDSLSIVSGKYRGTADPRLLEVVGEKGEIIKGRKLPSRPTPPPSPAPEPPSISDLVGCWNLELLQTGQSSQPPDTGVLRIAAEGDSIKGAFVLDKHEVAVTGSIIPEGPDNVQTLYVSSSAGQGLKMFVLIDIFTMKVFAGHYGVHEDAYLIDRIGRSGDVLSGEKDSDCTHQALLK